MRALALFVLACAVANMAWAARGGWPSVPAPNALAHFRLGKEMTASGVPMRVDGYVVARGVAELRNWYRGQLRGPLVENRIGNQLVLGQRQGGYFTTISMEPLPGAVSTDYTKVLVATLRGGVGESWDADLRRLPAPLRDWSRRLPVDTQVMSELRDREGGRQSLQLSAVNRHGALVNESHLRRELELLGFRLRARKETGGGRQQGLYFESPQGEAALVLGRVEGGLSSIVLNIFMGAGS